MIIHFSCGATSAIAGAIALKKDPGAELIYTDTMAEHPDNARFLKDCEDILFKKRVTVIRTENLYDHLARKKVTAFSHGASCTTDLKKIPTRKYLGDRLLDEVQVYGFDVGEMDRIEKFKRNNHELKIWLPLLDHGLSKANCLSLLIKLNIKIPAMYELGYAHSNCIGCVKAQSLSYWAAIKQDFPEQFKWFAQHERNIGRSINKRYKGYLYLDEFTDDIKPKRDLEISCGYSCGMVENMLLDRRSNEGLEDLTDMEKFFDIGR